MQDLSAIVLAAGRGVRMQSDLPKVFHKLSGKPLLEHVLDTLEDLGVARIYVVVGYGREVIEDYFKNRRLTFIYQREQLGTGHAVLQCEETQQRDGAKNILVLAGDVPLLRAETLAALINFHHDRGAAATDLTAKVPDPGGYGRVLRDQNGRIERIVEKKDASAEQLKINEINTGTFCFDAQKLFSALHEVKAENAQGEYYLTDTIEILKKQGHPVYAFTAPDYRETLGINNREQLAELENLQKRLLKIK